MLLQLEILYVILLKLKKKRNINIISHFIINNILLKR